MATKKKAKKTQSSKPTKKKKASNKKASAKKKKRRSYRDIFMDTLRKLSGAESKLVTNTALRSELGWDEQRYKSIKSQLHSAETIILGPGQGGKVGPATTAADAGVSVFVSYSHADEALKNELVKHLEPLRRKFNIKTWHDRKIKPGEEWDQKISANLEDAKIILLLISIDFINSKYCYDIELETAMQRHDAGEARVVPVILRSCAWHTSPFAKLQALPKDGKAVSTWQNQDEALTSVAEALKTTIEDMISRGV